MNFHMVDVHIPIFNLFFFSDLKSNQSNLISRLKMSEAAASRAVQDFDIFGGAMQWIR